jgi:hypothetical protein
MQKRIFMKGTAYYLTIALLLFNAAGAFYGGFFLMMDPTGHLLHLNTYRLMTSPFLDYFYPGLVLFMANGVLSLTAAIALWKGAQYALYLVLLQGFTLIGWIVIQASMLEMFNEWHLAMAVTGMTLAALASRSIIRRQTDRDVRT